MVLSKCKNYTSMIGPNLVLLSDILTTNANNFQYIAIIVNVHRNGQEVINATNLMC